ncbi:transporter [Massilia consociata]|uniref:Transporter n=1 Tax=Massilia consociata TaxID=760117 RepID=A0ABV6FGE3_9BURK
MNYTARLAATTAAAAAFAAGAFCAAPVRAQEQDGARDSINAGRPDFVESSNVVGKGRLQLETGVVWERDRGGGGRERILSTPTLLRIGVADTVELRVETAGRVVRHASENGERATQAGYGDAALGVSWHAMDAAGSLPSVGVLLSADLDTGSRAFRGQGVRPSLRVVGEWDLPNGYALGVMPGIGVERDDGHGGRYRYGILGVIVAKSFGERLRGLVEVAMPHIARSAHGGTQASFDVGAAYLLSRDVQIDAMLSRGLNSRTPDLALTVGLSIRR